MLPDASAPLGLNNISFIDLVLEGTVWAWDGDIEQWPGVHSRLQSLPVHQLQQCSPPWQRHSGGARVVVVVVVGLSCLRHFQAKLA